MDTFTTDTHATLVGNISQITQNSTASVQLTIASKTHESSRFWRDDRTKFRPRAARPELNNIITVKYTLIIYLKNMVLFIINDVLYICIIL